MYEPIEGLGEPEDYDLFIIYDDQAGCQSTPYYYINEKGEKAFSGVAGWSSDHLGQMAFSGGRAFRFIEDSYGYIDKSGKLAIPCIYKQETAPFKFNENGVALFRTENGEEVLWLDMSNIASETPEQLKSELLIELKSRVKKEGFDLDHGTPSAMLILVRV